MGLSFPLLCLASRSNLGAPGGSNRCLQTQQVTRKDVSLAGKAANELDRGGRYSIWPLHAGYGQVTLTYASFGLEGRMSPVVEEEAIPNYIQS